MRNTVRGLTIALSTPPPATMSKKLMLTIAQPHVREILGGTLVLRLRNLKLIAAGTHVRVAD
jgi:hypothetical protein